MAAPMSTRLAFASKTAQLASCKRVEFPEERKLRNLEKVPTYPFGVRPPKMFKDLATIRGAELVHNRLLYNQYGIIAHLSVCSDTEWHNNVIAIALHPLFFQNQYDKKRTNQSAALSGAFLRPGHIDMIRLNINKKLDVSRMFAVWRIDPPWKPITKKGQGKRMGKGKGAIDHYVTPIKAGRIIIEMGGYVEFEEVKPLLEQVCHKLPVDAMPITNELLEEIKLEEEELERRNINPFSIERVIDYKMHDSARWISKYDRKFYTKYV